MSLCNYLEQEEQLDSEFEELENTCNRLELERIVAIYISNYFKDKEIKNSVNIISPKYINSCIDTNICDGVDLAYKAMEKSGRFLTSASEHSISDDIRLVIKILGQIKKFAPQEFSAGILLMHLELIEGISLF
jgi:hypothetical protein